MTVARQLTSSATTVAGAAKVAAARFAVAGAGLADAAGETGRAVVLRAPRRALR